MSESIAVCVATFGDESWDALGQQAFDSLDDQNEPPDQACRVHGETLATARNQAARECTADWLIYLDADDRLDVAYVQEMRRALMDLGAGNWMIQPATLGVHLDGHEDDAPWLIPSKPLIDGNFMVIGTMVRREQVIAVDGFGDWPMYEDWDLWLRLFIAGATPVPHPAAVYRVGVRPDGRNNQAPDLQLQTYHAIRNSNLAAWSAREAA